MFCHCFFSFSPLHVVACVSLHVPSPCLVGSVLPGILFVVDQLSLYPFCLVVSMHTILFLLYPFPLFIWCCSHCPWLSFSWYSRLQLIFLSSFSHQSSSGTCFPVHPLLLLLLLYHPLNLWCISQHFYQWMNFLPQQNLISMPENLQRRNHLETSQEGKLPYLQLWFLQQQWQRMFAHLNYFGCCARHWQHMIACLNYFSNFAWHQWCMIAHLNYFSHCAQCQWHLIAHLNWS